MRLGLGLGLNRIALGGGGGVTLTIDALTFTAGDPATLEIDVTYTGSEELTAYAVTGTDPVTVTADQLVAGSGGTNTLEFFNFGVTPPNDTDDITGLTSASNSADRILVVIEDANGVRSAVAEVTVSGLSFGLTSTYLGDFTASGAQTPTGVYEFTGITHGAGTLVAVVGQRSSGGGGATGIDSMTMAGQAAAIVSDGVTDAYSNYISSVVVEAWSAVVSAGTSSVSFDLGGDANQGVAMHLYLVEGSFSVGEVTTDNPGLGTTTPLDVSANVASGDLILVGALSNSGSGSTHSYTGATKDGEAYADGTSSPVSAGRHAATAAETPRTITVTPSATSNPLRGFSIVLNPS